ncbi:hypothetical protein [Mucilaginibacter sp. OK268]|uniref:hypothetical protein n=1 Tax=Mucilaginibacter sp. OK268 TaxID=1881048 RepID=UPI0015A27161|nr:hypothetical protein [Mucilaginibacter sp. OK268]
MIRICIRAFVLFAGARVSRVISMLLNNLVDESTRDTRAPAEGTSERIAEI